MKDERSPAKAMHIAMTSSPAWLLPKWVETDEEIILLAIAISMGNFPRVKFVRGVADRNCSQRSFAFVPKKTFPSAAQGGKPLQSQMTGWRASDYASPWRRNVKEWTDLFSFQIRSGWQWDLLFPYCSNVFFGKEKFIQDILAESSGETRSSKTFVTRLGTSPLQRKKSCSCCSSSRSLTIRTKTALRSNWSISAISECLWWYGCHQRAHQDLGTSLISVMIIKIGYLGKKNSCAKEEKPTKNTI